MPDGKPDQPCGAFHGREEIFSGSVVAQPVKLVEATISEAKTNKK